MSNIDMEAFGEEKMNDVLSITKSMNVKKEKNLNELITNMSEIQNKGLNVKQITYKLKSLGIKTIEIKEMDIAKIEEMKKHDNKKCILWFDGTKFCVFK